MCIVDCPWVLGVSCPSEWMEVGTRSFSTQVMVTYRRILREEKVNVRIHTIVWDHYVCPQRPARSLEFILLQVSTGGAG